MSWFSKNKKESDASMLPEIPRSGNFMVKNRRDLPNEEDMNHFPALPSIPKKENIYYKKTNEDLDNFNSENFSNPQTSVDFTRDMNEMEDFANPPVYNSISDIEQPKITKSNFENPRPLRNLDDNQYMPSNDYRSKRVPINTPVQRIMPAPDYINNDKKKQMYSMNSNMNYEENIEKKKVFTKDTEPIYIRLDRFQTTIDSFEEIKSKINEIESLLNKTREIRAKEEKELEEWEQEIGIIKSKLDLIDKNIFEKVG